MLTHTHTPKRGRAREGTNYFAGSGGFVTRPTGNYLCCGVRRLCGSADQRREVLKHTQNVHERERSLFTLPSPEALWLTRPTRGATCRNTHRNVDERERKLFICRRPEALRIGRPEARGAETPTNTWTRARGSYLCCGVRRLCDSADQRRNVPTHPPKRGRAREEAIDLQESGGLVTRATRGARC